MSRNRKPKQSKKSKVEAVNTQPQETTEMPAQPKKTKKPSSLLAKASIFRKSFAPKSKAKANPLGMPETSVEETETLQHFDFDPLKQSVEASAVDENVDAVLTEEDVESPLESADDAPLTLTRPPRTLKVGPTSEYDYFDDIVNLLVKGDTVQFETGAHVILTSNINVDDITFLGSNATDTLVDFVPREDGPLFNLNAHSTLQLKSISVRVAPKSRLAIYENHSRIIMDGANLHWNHYKIQNHLDNLPLIAPRGPKDILDKFKATDTYTHTLDVYAKSMSISNSSIGDDDGSAGVLSGWADVWRNANVHNMTLSAAGTINTLTVLGRVIIEDIPIRFSESYPNLRRAPLVINNLLFGRVIASSPDAMLKGKGSIPEKLSRFTKAVLGDDADTAIKLKKKYDKSKNLSSKEQLAREYEFVNLKDSAVTYINFDSYNITSDRRPICNAGNLVISGTTNTSKSQWASIQVRGTLRFVEFQSEWLWAFKDEDAKENSRFDAYQSNWSDEVKGKVLKTLEPTVRKPNSAEVPRRPAALEVENVRAKYLAEVLPWEESVETLIVPRRHVNILVHKGITKEAIIAVLRRKETKITTVSSQTMRVYDPIDKVKAFESRKSNIWVIDDLDLLDSRPKWRTAMLNSIFLEDPGIQILFLSSNKDHALNFKARLEKLPTDDPIQVNITSITSD